MVLPGNFHLNPKKQIIFAGYFILKKSFCDIWRTRNPKTKRYTFRKNRTTGFIQERLTIFSFQKSFNFPLGVQSLWQLFPLTTFQVFFYFKQTEKRKKKANGFWKFNNSLVDGQTYVDNMKIAIWYFFLPVIFLTRIFRLKGSFLSMKFAIIQPNIPKD